jgi:hypothetical protein
MDRPALVVNTDPVRESRSEHKEREMKKRYGFRLGSFCAAMVLCAAGVASAQETIRPIQIALFHPVQLFPKETGVAGVRFSLIYGVNSSLTGLDVGLVNRTTGSIVGLQYGIVGKTDGDFMGWQDNFVNLTGGKLNGLATAAYNQASSGVGIQWGLVNNTHSFSGLQLGVLNLTDTMNGLQIGVLNVIRKKEKLPVFPIVNWQFD